MTRKQAERIMQMPVTELSSADGAFRFEARADGILVRGRGSTQKKALEKLVDNNYKRVCAIVAQSQRYRCANCSTMVPLQFHHVEHRSKGRVDTVENLVGLCQAHHARMHGG